MSSELHAFLDACRAVGPDAVTACPGWTAHDAAAHQAASCAEVVRHLDPFLHGAPVPATRSFEEREAPFRALAPDDLLDRVVVEEAAMHEVVGRVLADDPDAVVPWTGRSMVVGTFPTHLRSEFALHRWDLVGSDPVGDHLLADPALTAHALSVLGGILPRAGAARDEGGPFAVTLRAPGHPDVVVETSSEGARVRWAEPGDRTVGAAGLELDAAARLLRLWGRTPMPASRVRSTLRAADLRRVQDLLAGY